MLYSVETVLKKENTLFSQKNNNKKNTSPCAERSDYAGPNAKYITAVLIAYTVYVVTHYTCYFP